MSEIKLCGMTNTFQANRGSKYRTPITVCMQRMYELGYRKMDLGLAYFLFNEPDCDITEENWEEKAYEIKALADKLGIEFVQGHLPFARKTFNPKDKEEVETLQKNCIKGINIAAVCQAKWMVVHPMVDPDSTPDCIEKNVKANLDFYAPIMDIAFKNNVGICFENIPNWNSPRFGSKSPELLAILDAYNNPLVQACWDFGHANINYGKEQTLGIEQLGSHLKTVHVHDNKGSNDDHIVPYAGNIVWEEIFKSLKKIGFDGYWTFETTFQNNFPDDFKDRVVLFEKELAESMIEKYNSLKI